MYYYEEKSIRLLENFERKKISIKNMRDELEELQYEKMSLGGMSDSDPVQGSNINKQEKKMLDILSRQEDLENDIKKTSLEIGRIDRSIESIEEKEKTVLDRCYINKLSKPIDRLCIDFNYSSRQVYNLRETALYNFTIALRGKIDI